MVTINLTPASVISASVSESTISVSLTTTPISVTVSDGITIAAGDTRYLRRANNLSDLANAGTARTNLGVVIGTDVQAWDAQLDDIAALAVVDGNFIVGDGTNWVAESGSTVRTSLGLVAGGAGDIWVEKAGDTMAGDLIIPDGYALVIGHSVQITAFSISEFQVLGTGNEDTNIIFGKFSNTGGGPFFNFVKSRSTLIGESTLVQDGDDCGGILGTAADGTDLRSQVARIIFQIDGPPGANDTPGRIVFSTTPDGSAVITERVRIDSSGNVILKTGNLQLKSNLELRFYDNGNYVGFEAPALSADQIWVLPNVDGKDGDVLTSNGSGTLSWLSGASEKSWAFRSRSGAFGTAYAGGFYEHSSSANDFSTGPTFGTANAARAAHFFIVTGADTVDELTIRITGTSILDTAASRATGATEDIVIPNSTTAGAYYETTKKWLGTVTITIVSGTAKICDYGFAKYWDNNNTDFAVVGLEATWLGGATDTAPNLILRHHKGTDANTDWTYTGSGATPPTAIAAMATDHSATEDNVVSGENGAWKRTDLSVSINGSGKEGTIFEIVTTANKTFELGALLLRITPQ